MNANTNDSGAPAAGGGTWIPSEKEEAFIARTSFNLARKLRGENFVEWEPAFDSYPDSLRDGIADVLRASMAQWRLQLPSANTLGASASAGAPSGQANAGAAPFRPAFRESRQTQPTIQEETSFRQENADGTSFGQENAGVPNASANSFEFSDFQAWAAAPSAGAAAAPSPAAAASRTIPFEGPNDPAGFMDVDRSNRDDPTAMSVSGGISLDLNGAIDHNMLKAHGYGSVYGQDGEAGGGGRRGGGAASRSSGQGGNGSSSYYGSSFGTGGRARRF